jgi:subtilisin family serine protease
MSHDIRALMIHDRAKIASGTSFSAAYISGLAPLLLERNPALQPDEGRVVLVNTARDLGMPGRDDLFGAGEADALRRSRLSAPCRRFRLPGSLTGRLLPWPPKISGTPRQSRPRAMILLSKSPDEKGQKGQKTTTPLNRVRRSRD